jgi:hypothetical protein
MLCLDICSSIASRRSTRDHDVFLKGLRFWSIVRQGVDPGSGSGVYLTIELRRQWFEALPEFPVVRCAFLVADDFDPLIVHMANAGVSPRDDEAPESGVHRRDEPRKSAALDAHCGMRLRCSFYRRKLDK